MEEYLVPACGTTLEMVGQAMGILGIGVDICDVSRMKSFSLESRFTEHFFSDAEREYLQGKKAGLAQSMAGMYAAKEAFSKVLGSGVRGFELKEVEILHGSAGQPYYLVTGKALAALQARGIEEVHLSISHDGDMAVAFAVGEGLQP